MQATYAFTDENKSTINEEVRDTFIMGVNNNRTRLYLIEKKSSTASETLEFAINYEAAVLYNESIKKFHVDNN